jgi:hypothetical protein
MNSTFTQAVSFMHNQGPDVYRKQITPLCTCLVHERLYVGRRFAKREEIAVMPWDHVFNLQAPRGGDAQVVWYEEHLPTGCVLHKHSLPRSNDLDGPSDKTIMAIVQEVVYLLQQQQCIFIHDNEDGRGPAAVVATLAWHIADAHGGKHLDPDLAPVPEEKASASQLKRLLRAAQETLESAWKRGAKEEQQKKSIFVL